MGKPTGFKEFERIVNPACSPAERILHYREFHPALDKDDRQKQGARCMNCGIPFCQSALTISGAVSCCPLHNLIPEWNDEIFGGNWGYALARLLKTNNFPEFTGRVCPALCEAACTCSLYDSPVTIKENELAIIECGFAEGFMTPRVPKTRTGRHVAVIGSGPAGLAVADQLNHRGHQVTVFEKEDRPGGLLMYGIPNMKLEKQVITRRIDLMREEGVTFITGADIGFKDSSSAAGAFSADAILRDYDAVVLCCGAKNPRTLSVPAQDIKDVCFALDFLSSTTRSLLDSDGSFGVFSSESPKGYISAKDKDVVIVGGGDTGNDCVGTCIRHGCRSVVQLEMMPKAPDTRAENNPWPQWPLICKTDYGQEEALSLFGSDPRIYQTTVKDLITDKDGALTGVMTVRLKAGKDAATGRIQMTEIPDSEETIHAQLLLVAAGFLGCRQYVADAFGVELDSRTNVKTAADSYHTGVDKVFTAGDMHRGQSLVVWAIAEGRAAAKEVDAFLMGYTNII